jgi:hypothetical protein
MTEESNNTQQVPQCLTTEHFVLQTAAQPARPYAGCNCLRREGDRGKQNRNPSSIH